jgi:hypothetical protein
MSWDVIVQNYRGNPPPDDELDTEPEPLGSAATVRERIDAHLPGVVWSDDLHGVFVGEDFSIEFDIGDEEPVTTIMLSVRGGGDAFGALKSFAVPNQWSLFDCSESSFLDLDSPTAEGFEAFQEFRDRAISGGSRRSKNPAAGKKRGQPKQEGTARPKGKRKPKKD